MMAGDAVAVQSSKNRLDTRKKEDFVSEIAAATGITKVAAERVFEAMLDSMTAALQEGDAIQLRRFGSFVVHTRKQRRGRDPKTGSIVVFPPAKTAKFLPSRELRAMLNPEDPRVNQ